MIAGSVAGAGGTMDHGDDYRAMPRMKLRRDVVPRYVARTVDLVTGSRAQACDFKADGNMFRGYNH